jgi:hypothetical protein
MSNEKHTALDIFFSKLGMHEQWVMQHDFEQAKEMEKQQIMEAYVDGQDISDGYEGPSDYYNKEYGGKNAE